VPLNDIRDVVSDLSSRMVLINPEAEPSEPHVYSAQLDSMAQQRSLSSAGLDSILLVSDAQFEQACAAIHEALRSEMSPGSGWVGVCGNPPTATPTASPTLSPTTFPTDSPTPLPTAPPPAAYSATCESVNCWENDGDVEPNTPDAGSGLRTIESGAAGCGGGSSELRCKQCCDGTAGCVAAMLHSNGACYPQGLRFGRDAVDTAGCRVGGESGAVLKLWVKESVRATCSIPSRCGVSGGRCSGFRGTALHPVWLVGNGPTSDGLQHGMADRRPNIFAQSCDVVCATQGIGQQCHEPSLQALANNEPAVRVAFTKAGRKCVRFKTNCVAKSNCDVAGAPFVHDGQFRGRSKPGDRDTGLCWSGFAPSVATCAQTPVDRNHKRLCPCIDPGP